MRSSTLSINVPSEVYRRRAAWRSPSRFVHWDRIYNDDIKILQHDDDHYYRYSTLRRAQLVLRWVTACGQVNHFGAKPAS